MISPKTILVVATRRIGDVLLATPLIRSLARAWPDAQIDALVFESTQGILAANPDLQRVIAIDERPRFLVHLKFIARLWRHYDLAVSTLPGDRPTLYAWVAGKYRVGVLADGREHLWKQKLMSRWAPFDNLNTHTVLMNLAPAHLLGIPRCHEVVVSWSNDDESQVVAALPFDLRSRAFALLHVYPMFAYKTWHRQGWAELARWLDDHGMRVVLTGGNSPAELAYVEELLALLPGDTVALAGKLTLGQVGFLAGRARVFVGPDTAVTHMAAALGVPTVALYGPTNPVKWGPWPKDWAADRNPYVMRGSQTVGNVTLLQGITDCVPCREEGCERHIDSLSDCLQHLPASRVIAAVARALNVSPGAAATPARIIPLRARQ